MNTLFTVLKNAENGPAKINLVVGDYFKHISGMLRIMNNAYNLVQWFKNHSYALGLLCKCQAKEYNGHVLALIQPVITHWTAHYCSAARLLEVKEALCICIARHEPELLESAGPANSDARRAAASTLAISKQPDFWDLLAAYVLFIKPKSLKYS
jgi:hypothetical protein